MKPVILVLLLCFHAHGAEKPEKTFTVDAQWMAQYKAMEVKWKYPIPEDKDIRYENGKFIVPVVVYRHYEDMANTTAKREGK
jgi:hypothetical protein